MKNFVPILLTLILLALQVYAKEPPVENLVVLHTAGPNWKMRAEHTKALQEHGKIYQELARKGDILFGGRLQGEPVLGMSVFRSDIDREKVSAELKLDPSVVAGVITLEFRVWQTQLGKLPDPTRQMRHK
jgi:hypothetical protein